jgi:hypothetical protein
MPSKTDPPTKAISGSIGMLATKPFSYGHVPPQPLSENGAAQRVVRLKVTAFSIVPKRTCQELLKSLHGAVLLHTFVFGSIIIPCGTFTFPKQTFLLVCYGKVPLRDPRETWSGNASIAAYHW